MRSLRRVHKRKTNRKDITGVFSGYVEFYAKILQAERAYMASINYPQDSSEKGPWLLGRESFEELDEILTLANEKLVDSWEQLVEERVQERLSSEDGDDGHRSIIENNLRDTMAINSEKHFELVGRDGVKLVDNTLTGLLRDDSLKEFKPIAF